MKTTTRSALGLKALLSGLMLLVFCLVLFTPANSFAVTESGGTIGDPDDTKVCKTFRKRNRTGETATDVHFKAWQKEDNIHINGWQITIECCDNITGTTPADQPEPQHSRIQTIGPDPPPPAVEDDGSHAVDVDATGCSVPPGGVCKIKVCFWLTAWNTIRMDDFEWTFDAGDEPEDEEDAQDPDEGNEVHNPAPNIPGGTGNPQVGNPSDPWRHVLKIINDDPVRTLVYKDLVFHTSTTDYANLDDVPFDPSGAGPDPVVTLPPGHMYKIDVLTPTPVHGGFVYGQWDVYELVDGDTEVPLSSDTFQHMVPDDDWIIPTLTEWGFIIFGSLLLASVVFYIYRRRRLATMNM